MQAGLWVIGGRCDDVCKPSMRIEVGEPANLDGRVDGGGALTSMVELTGYLIPPSDCGGTDTPFSGIVGHTDAAGIDEARSLATVRAFS